MCQRLKDQIANDGKGLESLGELSEKVSKRLVKDVLDTASEVFEENNADENTWSHADFPHD